MSPIPRAARHGEPLPDAAARPATLDGASFARSQSKRCEHGRARGNFNLYFLFPIIAIVAGAMIALVGLTLWLTTLQDRAAVIKERDRVEASFTARVEAIEAITKVFAVWDDAARHLVVQFDPTWADTNVAAYVLDQNGFETTFVVDQSGRTLYGFVDGKRSPADPAAVLGNGFAGAIARALARGVANEPFSGASISPRGTAIFSIVRIRAHGPSVRTPPNVNRYLVMAKLIDGGVVNALSRASNGAPLSFSTVPRAGFSNWTFAAYDGQGTRSFLWLPSAPGTRLLHRALPWLIMLICVMTLLAWLVLQRARKAARELESSETRALYLASRDSLTGLPNRRCFTAHLLDLGRGPCEHSLLFLDLDGFKRINDIFGHGVGDRLLCRTAERLQRVIPPNAFLARLGGDEFAITLATPQSVATLDLLAARLIEAVGEPHNFGGEPISVGVSIGIASNECGKYDDIVRHADTAMYASKQTGRNDWQHYRSSLEQGRGERRRLESDLKQALAERQIFVVFQPIVDAVTHRITAVEALARWTHPVRGAISPDIFIPIAEESGLIIELGRQILDQACAAARHWPFRLAVNLSPAQFSDRNLVDDVMSTLERCQFSPARLEFEITETYLLRRPEAAEAVIKALRRRGIRIALDDFGTGYACIGYLRRFQFDLVKIDRSLVEAVVFDPAAAEVLLAIVSLCRALGLPMLAEGVETPEQAAILTDNGCNYLQGWHFGRPVRATHIDAMVANVVRRVA